jgi:hypothetical protein
LIAFERMTSSLRAAPVRRHVSGLVLVLASALLLPRPSFAQSDEERAAARQAAMEGIKALREQRYSAAVDLLTRAESVIHAPTHLLYLARAQASMGQLVRARENFMKIVKENIDSSKPKAFHEAKADAEKELAALEPRIPVITAIVEGAQGKSVTVTMDGTKISSALIGLPRPVDPGAHQFQASTEGMASDVATVSIKEGGNERVTLVLKAGAVAVVTAPPTPTPPEPAASTSHGGTGPEPLPTTGTPPAPEQPQTGGGGGSGVRTAGFVVTGVGVVGIGVGTLMYLGGVSKSQESTDTCAAKVEGGPCAFPKSDPRAQEVDSLDADAKSKKLVGAIGLAAGGVALVAGVVMIVAGKPKPAAQADLSPHVAPFLGAREIGLVGTF